MGMQKLFHSDNERKNAIEEIWKQIDEVMSLKQKDMDYLTARTICDNLNMLADTIYAEVKDKTAVRRYKE